MSGHLVVVDVVGGGAIQLKKKFYQKATVQNLIIILYCTYFLAHKLVVDRTKRNLACIFWVQVLWYDHRGNDCRVNAF